MSPPVTVLIPTLDHGPTLRYSVASALGQEGVEVEVIIVGDGMPEPAAEAAREVAAGDERVRLFEFEKGPRHGEVHRAAVLEAEATGEVVLYLADDDLWLPGHAAMAVDALADADFLAAVACVVRAGGELRTLFHEVGDPECRELMLDQEHPYNRVPFSCIGHTMDAYRKLTPGWHTSPEDVWTDLHFMRQFLGNLECRAVSLREPTVVHFPSPERGEMSGEQRVGELARWWDRIGAAAADEALAAELRDAAWQRAVELELTTRRFKLRVNELKARQRQLQERDERRSVQLAGAERRAAEFQTRITEIERSRSWRALERARRTSIWRRTAQGVPWGRAREEGQ